MISMAGIYQRIARAACISKDAVISKSYFYPPLGTLYLFNHSQLWKPLVKQILPCTGLSIAVIVPMFLFTYLPQAAVLSITSGPVGILNAAMLVLSESGVIITWLLRSFLLRSTLVDLFDATLVCEGREELVSKGRILLEGNKILGAKKLGKSMIQPLQKFSLSYLISYVTLLPLNLIPVVGTTVFLVMQGRKMGPIYHTRYFQLKGFNENREKKFVREHMGGYIAFGTTAMILNLLPLTTLFFTFSSTVGAALWAADIERHTQYIQVNRSPRLQDVDESHLGGKEL